MASALRLAESALQDREALRATLLDLEAMTSRNRDVATTLDRATAALGEASERGRVASDQTARSLQALVVGSHSVAQAAEQFAAMTVSLRTEAMRLGQSIETFRSDPVPRDQTVPVTASIADARSIVPS